jgi:hypothetical protein
MGNRCVITIDPQLEKTRIVDAVTKRIEDLEFLLGVRKQSGDSETIPELERDIEIQKNKLRLLELSDPTIDDQVGVYLHWNGGRDSVEAFLKYCDIKGHRSPDSDNYGWARLAQVIGNFFGGTLSIGIDVCRKLDCDNYDNGVYLIKDWKIVGRQYKRGGEQTEYNLLEMLVEIDKKQPIQLGKEFIEQKLNLETEDPMTMLDDLLQQATTITKKYSKASK